MLPENGHQSVRQWLRHAPGSSGNESAFLLEIREAVNCEPAARSFHVCGLAARAQKLLGLS